MAETTTGTLGSGANSSSINPFSMIGAGADMMTNFLPQPTEYSGDAGNISAGIDSAWDGTSNAMMGFPPVGTAIGGIMKGTKFLGRAINALGAGTDGMTTQDAILGSPLFNLTPFGLINGLFGKKADTFTKDLEVFAQMGSSYSGTSSLADAAASKSGKKYGLFSRGAMYEANRLMRETKSLLNLIKDILEDTNELNLRALSMTQQASLQYANRMSGGYQQGMIRAAKQGTALFNKLNIDRAKLFVKNGSKLSLVGWPKEYTSNKDFVKFLKTCPEDIHIFSDEYNMLYDIWESIGQPSNYKEVEDFIIPILSLNADGKHQINPDYLELLQNDDDIPEFVINNLKDDSNEVLLSFKEGGLLNVIPEGALHAEKHNLEQIDESLKGNITHKGIPVVSVDEEGNIELLAEVERNELILNLETTNAIEECRKEYHSCESLSKKKLIAEEAGRIFAKSVIENTDDRTNLMNTV